MLISSIVSVVPVIFYSFYIFIFGLSSIVCFSSLFCGGFRVVSISSIIFIISFIISFISSIIIILLLLLLFFFFLLLIIGFIFTCINFYTFVIAVFNLT